MLFQTNKEIKISNQNEINIIKKYIYIYIMSEANIELLRTLKNEALISTIGGALVLTISSIYLGNDNYKKNTTLGTRFKLPVLIGIIYGTTTVINGSLGMNKYSQLLNEAQLPEINISIYLSIPFENLVDSTSNVMFRSITRSIDPDFYNAKYDITKLTNSIKEYIAEQPSLLKVTSLTIEDISTGGASNGNNVSSNVRADIGFISLSNKKTSDILQSILSGTIELVDTNNKPRTLAISSIPSKIFNYAYY